MSLPSRLLGANPSIQVSTLLSGSLTTPSAKGTFTTSDYQAIATYTSTGSDTFFDFTSIPSDYRYLEVRGYGTHNSINYANVAVRMNGDSTTGNYRWIFSVANNTAKSSATDTNSNHLPILQSFPSTSNNMGVCVFVFNEYKATNKYKTVTSYGGGTESNSTVGEVSIGAGTWLSTSAITSLRFFNTGGPSWSAGSKFVLYGVI
jgi:hypothetical protein